MAPPPPPLLEDLVEEILLRLPPDDPACLLRASLVCKAWGSVVSRRAFHRRLHELHRTPPLLGFLRRWSNKPTPCFVPTTGSSLSLAAPDHRSWRALDCRHGRALFVSEGHDRYARELLVWEPITGAQHRIPWPAAIKSRYYTTAVLCAAGGCDHSDCLSGPFHVLIDVDDQDTDDGGMFYDEPVISVCVYSSETGAWRLTSSLLDSFIIEPCDSSVLVGSSLLYFMLYDSFHCVSGGELSILEYDVSRHTLTVFSFIPDDYLFTTVDYGGEYYWGDCHLVLVEDGGLGVIQDLDPHLKLWTREASDDTDAPWVLSQVIDLGNLLPTSARLNVEHRVHVMGFAEGANAILVNTVHGVFTIKLQSEHVRKVYSDRCLFYSIPVVGFYTPASQGKHQNLPASKPSEEEGGEDGGEEQKTLDQAQQLLSKGSNDIQEGDFVNTFECVSNDNNIRVPCYGEVAPACANMFDKYGCEYKVQEVNDSSDDVHRSAPNEELVKGTTSKNDTGDSKDLW